MIITIAIIAVTSLVSYSAFKNQQMTSKLLFWPTEVKRNNEWTRFITSGFIHGGMVHLIVNMMVLYFFGPLVEDAFKFYFGPFGSLLFLAMYLLAIIISEIPSFIKHHNNPSYRSLGASGAVSAVLFAAILFNPAGKLLLYFVIPMNAVLFGILYVGYSIYMDKKQIDNIGHSAHLFGALFGFVFPIILKPSLFTDFLEKVQALLSL